MTITATTVSTFRLTMKMCIRDRPTLAFDYRRPVQQGRDAGAVEGGGHHQKAQVFA